MLTLWVSALPTVLHKRRTYISTLAKDTKNKWPMPTENVKLLGKPRLQAFYHGGPNDNKFYMCTDVTLTCEPLLGYPEVTMFHFYRNGILIRQGSKKGVYEIDGISREDEGTYTCVPENKLGRGLNKSLKIEEVRGKNVFTHS